MDKGVVGYGLVKDDFTIEEHDLASFVYMNDAVNYIEMRVGGEISNQKYIMWMSGTKERTRSGICMILRKGSCCHQRICR